MDGMRRQAVARDTWPASTVPSRGISARPAGRARPYAALVVVDAAIGHLIGRLLGQRGWDTQLATDPRHALVMSRRRPIDLLVADYELPGLTGLDLAARLWRRDVEVPVVVVSAWPEAAKLVAGARLAFVPKPVDLSVLLARVDAIVPAYATIEPQRTQAAGPELRVPVARVRAGATFPRADLPDSVTAASASRAGRDHRPPEALPAMARTSVRRTDPETRQAVAPLYVGRSPG